jgi:hypothetical protein
MYIMYSTSMMVYIYVYYSCGLIKHGLKKLLLYISLILSICKDDNTSIIHKCIKNKYYDYHIIIMIKLISKICILIIKLFIT